MRSKANQAITAALSSTMKAASSLQYYASESDSDHSLACSESRLERGRQVKSRRNHNNAIPSSFFTLSDSSLLLLHPRD